MAPLATIFLSMFGGYVVNINSIPAVFAWLQYISLIKYGYHSFSKDAPLLSYVTHTDPSSAVYNEFAGLTFTCSDNPSDVCIRTGEAVLDAQGMNYGVASDLIILLAMSLILRFMAYFLLRVFSKPKTKLA